MIKEIVEALPRNNKLLRQITRLNIIAGSPETAYRFGPDLKKLEVVIYSKNILGHAAGLKKFWKLNLPTLKFHNDAVDFVVTRVKPTKREDFDTIPLQVRLHNQDGSVSKLDCVNKSNLVILSEVVALTGATAVPVAEIPVIHRYKDHVTAVDAETEAPEVEAAEKKEI